MTHAPSQAVTTIASNEPQAGEREQPKESQAWMSLLIAMAPVGAYALTLSYIVGFAGFFAVPAPFLSVNIATMFSVAGNLLIPAYLILQIFFTAYFLIPREEHPVAEKVVLVLPYVAILVMKLVLFSTHWLEWAPFMLIIALLSLLIFSRKSIGLPRKDRRLSLYTRTTFFQKSLVLYVFAWMALTASHDAGRAEAMFRQEYLVPASAPDTVVLTSFGDNLIVAPFDRKAKEVDRSFSIIEKGKDPTLALRWERIGPLHLRPESQTVPAPKKPEAIGPQPTATKPTPGAPAKP